MPQARCRSEGAAPPVRPPRGIRRRGRFRSCATATSRRRSGEGPPVPEARSPGFREGDRRPSRRKRPAAARRESSSRSRLPRSTATSPPRLSSSRRESSASFFEPGARARVSVALATQGLRATPPRAERDGRGRPRREGAERRPRPRRLRRSISRSLLPVLSRPRTSRETPSPSRSVSARTAPATTNDPALPDVTRSTPPARPRAAAVGRRAFQIPRRRSSQSAARADAAAAIAAGLCVSRALATYSRRFGRLRAKITAANKMTRVEAVRPAPRLSNSPSSITSSGSLGDLTGIAEADTSLRPDRAGRAVYFASEFRQTQFDLAPRGMT